MSKKSLSIMTIHGNTSQYMYCHTNIYTPEESRIHVLHVLTCIALYCDVLSCEGENTNTNVQKEREGIEGEGEGENTNQWRRDRGEFEFPPIRQKIQQKFCRISKNITDDRFVILRIVYGKLSCEVMVWAKTRTDSQNQRASSTL